MSFVLIEFEWAGSARSLSSWAFEACSAGECGFSVLTKLGDSAVMPKISTSSGTSS